MSLYTCIGSIGQSHNYPPCGWTGPEQDLKPNGFVGQRCPRCECDVRPVAPCATPASEPLPGGSADRPIHCHNCGTRVGFVPAAQQPSDVASLREALTNLLSLVDAWMAGPVFRSAGISWPDPAGHPPAVRAARSVLAQRDGATP